MSAISAELRKPLHRAGVLCAESPPGHSTYEIHVARAFFATRRTDVRVNINWTSFVTVGSFHQDTHYQNADCILAKLLPVQELRTGAKVLQTVVEGLVREGDRRAITSTFGTDPISRDRLLQKLRRLLLALIDNAAEHA